MRINRQDTNGVKPLLAVGELGYDNYLSGGDIGRVYVGTGSSNIAQAKKSEVVTVDGKVDTHVARIDNPHGVTKTQVGLSNVDNTSDVNKPVSIAVQSALDTKQDVLVSGTNVKTIEGQSIVGSGNIDLSKSDVGLSNVDNTADSAKPVSTDQQTALNLKANLASPVFTGNVTGLGVATGTSFNSITGLSSVVGATSGTAAVGTSTTVARADHVHPSDTTKVTKVTSTDNAIVRFDGITGEVQISNVSIVDDGTIINNNTGLNISPVNGGLTSIYNFLDTSSLNIWAGATQKTGLNINSQSALGGSYVSISTGGAERVKVDVNGQLTINSPTGGIGYGDGAGGIVIQLTSKNTSVALNKPCGTVIMNNAALAAGNVVVFALNNSLLQVNDMLHVETYINSTAYKVSVYRTTAGLASIQVTNVSAVSLSDALAIKFAIIKGANS